MIKNDLIINKSFLIGENKVSLASYLTINPDEYISLLHSNYEEAREMLRDNLRSFEKLDEIVTGVSPSSSQRLRLRHTVSKT